MAYAYMSPPSVLDRRVVLDLTWEEARTLRYLLYSCVSGPQSGRRRLTDTVEVALRSVGVTCDTIGATVARSAVIIFGDTLYSNQDTPAAGRPRSTRDAVTRFGVTDHIFFGPDFD